VTAKIRLGCSRNHINANQVARVVERSGAAALTVHGRTAQDMFRGSADWERISEIKSSLNHIPLIGNGDIDSAPKAVEAFRRYHVDGIMVARACLGRPWLFRQIQAALRGEPVPDDPTLDEQRECLLLHYERVVERFGLAKGTMLMRKYGCRYAQGLAGARQFRTRIAKVASREDFRRVVEETFPRQS
jgi:tRNA-dihydrouridine synthase B